MYEIANLEVRLLYQLEGAVVLESVQGWTNVNVQYFMPSEETRVFPVCSQLLLMFVLSCDLNVTCNTYVYVMQLFNSSACPYVPGPCQH